MLIYELIPMKQIIQMAVLLVALVFFAQRYVLQNELAWDGYKIAVASQENKLKCIEKMLSDKHFYFNRQVNYLMFHPQSIVPKKIT